MHSRTSSICSKSCVLCAWILDLQPNPHGMSCQDILVHESAPRFPMEVVKPYLANYTLHELPLESDPTRFTTLSPHQFGWPCHRPRRYSVLTRDSTCELPQGISHLQYLFRKPRLSVEALFAAPQAGNGPSSEFGSIFGFVFYLQLSSDRLEVLLLGRSRSRVRVGFLSGRTMWMLRRLSLLTRIASRRGIQHLPVCFQVSRLTSTLLTFFSESLKFVDLIIDSRSCFRVANDMLTATCR